MEILQRRFCWVFGRCFAQANTLGLNVLVYRCMVAAMTMLILRAVVNFERANDCPECCADFLRNVCLARFDGIKNF